MKTLIIYCSTYKGNTKKIVQRFKDKLNSDLVDIRDFKGIDIDG